MNCVTFDNGTTGDDGQGTPCAGSHDPSITNVNGNDAPVGCVAYGTEGCIIAPPVTIGGRPGGGGGTSGGSPSNGSSPAQPGNPPKSGTPKPGYCNVSGSSSIVTATATKALTEVGAFVGSVFGPEGTLVGAAIGSQFGAGGNISYVNATHSVYIGVTGVFAPAQIGGGGGFSLSCTPVPATQNANSIANGTSYGVAFQANPLLGSVVSKSPGSGPPVVGFQAGTRSPVSFSASHNICIWHCGC